MPDVEIVHSFAFMFTEQRIYQQKEYIIFITYILKVFNYIASNYLMFNKL